MLVSVSSAQLFTVTAACAQVWRAHHPCVGGLQHVHLATPVLPRSHLKTERDTQSW
ncbi:hypothetical protein PF005_g14464 [Phytophthora fragariae]|uniref:Uncharacterized protein n=2 Tax=Phytophthora TaxID=4783 RepID=A0A6A3FQF4_9STRA|nr:hypothetical protein PF003_g3147 [Phytophthora fragariae]KAE9033518.1 hypothetical protein PR002_g8632 [Phytophthora rubi]KAE8946220.1 hypothetical protein PF009_g4141 [Phytophthora fragariae]KAE9013406.1 hypothetical protein PF011_g8497 [Phytophthora fragariae]KAE9037382.1 hypothetical protein PR001_g8401 [Phytophthora rubi]